MQTDNSTLLDSILSRVTIIGNAKGEWQLPSCGATFIFNATKAHDKKASNHNPIINISNGPFAGATSPFVVSGPFPARQLETLTHQLTEVANSLERELQCWPSTGLVTTVLMAKLTQQLDVKRMSLLPSLQRSPNMPIIQYLPCMVHNWLGERRIALGLETAKLNWPELPLEKPCSYNERDNSTVMKSKLYQHCPFSLLGKLNEHAHHKPCSTTESLKILSYLATSPIENWLEQSSQEKLLASELMFFNQTPEQNASFWYLIDNQASQYLDGIRHRLAYCQQALHSGAQFKRSSEIQIAQAAIP